MASSTIKLEIDGELRRFSVPDYATLYKRIVEILNNSKISFDSFKLSYVDSDNDTILVSSNEELQEAVATVAPNPLKLKVDVKKAVVATPTTPPTTPVNNSNNVVEPKQQQEQQETSTPPQFTHHHHRFPHRRESHVPHHCRRGFGNQVRHFFQSNPGLKETILPAVQTVLESLENDQQPEQQKQQPTTPVAPAVNNNNNKIRHFAYCDVCNETIVGIRYKCGNCSDYDLCEKCEALPRSQTHDETHVFLKIHTPITYRRFSPLLPSNLYQPAQPGFRCGYRHWGQPRVSMDGNDMTIVMDIPINQTSTEQAPPAQDNNKVEQNEESKQQTEINEPVISPEEEEEDEKEDEKEQQEEEQTPEPEPEQPKEEQEPEEPSSEPEENPRLASHVASLRQMGFQNDEAALKALLLSFNYDMSAVLDQLFA